MGKVILITIDSARQDAVYGDVAETPHLDKLRDDGVTFTEAFSQASHTIPSITSIFASCYLSDLRVICNPYKNISIPWFLPKYLTKHNWRTLAFCGTDFVSSKVKNHFSQTLTKNVILMSLKNICLKFILLITHPNIIKYSFLRVFFSLLARLLWKAESFSTRKITNLAVKNIRAAGKNDNLFIWLHYFDSHMPYFAPAKTVNYYLHNKQKHFQEKLKKIVDFKPKKDLQSGDIDNKEKLNHCMATYYAALTYIDENIGRLVDTLKAKNEYDDCMIIVTADHGENLFEGDYICNHSRLFDETTKVPLIIKFPKNMFKRKTYSRLVELVDIYPTVLAQFGINHSDNTRGVNLIPYLTGERKTEKFYAISEHFGNFEYSIRDDKWQLIESIPPDNWIINLKDKEKIKLANKINREETILLSRMQNDRNNFFNEFPHEAVRLKKQLETILSNND